MELSIPPNSYTLTMPLPIAGNRSEITLQDVWDEADDLESNASDILAQASNADCNSAIQSAEAAIAHAEDWKSLSDFNDAVAYLDEAESAFSEAQNYLSGCDDKSEEE